MTNSAPHAPLPAVVTIPTNGAFSLGEFATFGFGYRAERVFDGVCRLAFCVDGDYESTAGVEIRQPGEEALELTIRSTSPAEVVTAQVARILSVDVDGVGFAELGERDAVIGRLQAAAPGLRPPLFLSPYEAAAWGILSARRGQAQGKAVRTRLSEQHGDPYELAGRTVYAFPTPSRLLRVDEVGGLPADRVPKLQAIARAAQEGRLGVAHLRALGSEAAQAELRTLPGIGPFYASLIWLRACGIVDELPLDEELSRALVHQLYEIQQPMTDAEYARFAERWAPYRMWAVVLIRAVSGRLGYESPKRTRPAGARIRSG